MANREPSKADVLQGTLDLMVLQTLDTMGCLCSTMFRVSPNHLLWVLEGLVEGRIHNRIIVDEPQKSFARLALDRMLTV